MKKLIVFTSDHNYPWAKIGQKYCLFPFNSGLDIYHTLAEEGHNVQWTTGPKLSNGSKTIAIVWA